MRAASLASLWGPPSLASQLLQKNTEIHAIPIDFRSPGIHTFTVGAGLPAMAAASLASLWGPPSLASQLLQKNTEIHAIPIDFRSPGIHTFT
ncbi:hypothetical protein, partial [Pseudomonas laurylsulfatiphila]|uniref:hypothetical protein n=1 Tax=Pseudomonas laurylsulfatiphila TaxID=2011015 RepID=UPI003D1F6148